MGNLEKVRWPSKFNTISTSYHAQACSEPRQTSRMELFAETINGLHALTIFAKSPILDVRQSSEYASVMSQNS